MQQFKRLSLHSNVTGAQNSVFILITTFSSLDPNSVYQNNQTKSLTFVCPYIKAKCCSVPLFRNMLGRTRVGVKGNGEIYIARSLVF